MNAGLSPAQAFGLSVFVFAGASQLATVVAWRTESVLATIVAGIGALWTLRVLA